MLFLLQFCAAHAATAAVITRVLSLVAPPRRRALAAVHSQVHPSLPVVDMVTQIHGITPGHLEGVSFTLRHAQAAMAALCGPRTVLVGHALDNDLLALK